MAIFQDQNYFTDVEARRNAFTSLASIIVCIAPQIQSCKSAFPFLMPYIYRQALDLPEHDMLHAYELLFSGFEDYTINERGDVGSWVRMACAKGVQDILITFIGYATDGKMRFETLKQYLPLNIFHEAIGRILRQGVERLDNVRQCCGDLFTSMLLLRKPPDEVASWVVDEKDFFMQLISDDSARQWAVGSWIYPKAVRFLDVHTYRNAVLRGLLMSIGSKTSSTVCAPVFRFPVQHD